MKHAKLIYRFFLRYQIIGLPVLFGSFLFVGTHGLSWSEAAVEMLKATAIIEIVYLCLVILVVKFQF